MKLKSIIYTFFGFGIIYLISLNFYSAKALNNSGTKMNVLRVDIGIPKLNKNWKLNSICSYKNEYREITHKSFLFENDIYLLIWSNIHLDTLNAFHKTKEIYFEKNYIIWENKILSEIDIYTKPLSKEKYVELRSEYNYSNNKWQNKIDTLKTEYAKLKFKQDLKLASKKGIYLCGFATGLSLAYKLPSEITNVEKKKILKDWKIELN